MKPFNWSEWRDRWQRARDPLPPLDGVPPAEPAPPAQPIPTLPSLPAIPAPEITYICPICTAIELEHVIPVVTLQADGGVKLVEHEDRVATRDLYYPFDGADSVALCQHHLRTIELLSHYNVMFDAQDKPVYDHCGDWLLVPDSHWDKFSAYWRAEQIRGWKRHGRRLLRHKRGLNWMDGLDTPDADRLRWNEGE